jgi:hypothetical protein
MKMKAIKQVKKGEPVRLIRKGEACERVWIRGDYNACDKTYTLSAWDEWGRCTFAKGSRVVAVDFDF